MKEFFEQEWVAWIVLILSILLALAVGKLKAPQLIYDKAGRLDPSTEANLEDFNATWEDKYDTKVGVVIVDSVSTKKSYKKYVTKQFKNLKLGENDALLVISTKDRKIQYYTDPDGSNFDLFLKGNEVYDPSADVLVQYFYENNIWTSDFDESLGRYFEYLNTTFEAGWTPLTAEYTYSSSAFDEGMEELQSGVQEVAEKTGSIISTVFGWIFGLLGKFFSWFASLSVLGMIVVGIIIISIFKRD